MKLFTIGPVQMYPEILDEKGVQVPYFRTNEFSRVVFETEKMLKELVGTAASSNIIFLTASGTAAMESTVINLFTASDKILVVNGGTFGQRFCDICKCHKIPFEEIKLAFGEVLIEKHLQMYDGKGFTGFLVNLDETSTGQLYSIDLISAFCKKNGLCLVVDAISTFLCDPYEMDKYGIDATILSSQKGLCLSPGISFVILNEKTVNERVRCNSPQTLYFNFNEYLVNITRGQTPFTPAVSIIYELHAMMKKILLFGLENWLAEIGVRAEYFRQNILNAGLNIPDYPLSNAVTPVIFNQPVAEEVFHYLKDKKEIMVNPSGGEIGKKMFRVSHVGCLTLDDYDYLIDSISEAVLSCSGKRC
ncbi:MAG TPA: aminotransferase class V-fold PLP-dependent enzyme [Methanocorpusculum sp.]|nr:aminotransferase class V-fold PLP-dependent enzyme [Methanocorpusculum sp.]